MDRPLREGLDYWLPVAHATLLGAIDVGGNLVENIIAASIGAAARRRRREQQRRQRRRAAPPSGGDPLENNDDDDDDDDAYDDGDDPRARGAPVVDLSGHTAIVTGGNAGIGLTTARKLAERGCTVVVACRDAKRGADAAALLRGAARRPLAGCRPGAVEDARLDLSSLDSVRSFARQFNASGRPLSLLVCNAGVMSPPQRLSTGDGLELQLQTNAIGHWLLAHELLAHQRRRRAAAAGGEGGGGGGGGGSSSSKAAVAAAAGFLLPPEASPSQSSSLLAAAAEVEATARAAATAAAAAEAAGAASAAPGGGAAGGGQGAAAPSSAVAALPAAAAAASAPPPPPPPRPAAALAIAPPGRGTRVVVLSSLTHHAGPAQWEDKQSLRRYAPFVSYALSKLAGVVVAAELQRRFDAHFLAAAARRQQKGEEEEQEGRGRGAAGRRRYDGCPGAPACPGCVVCSEAPPSSAAAGRGAKRPPPVVFGRDTAISLHPGIVATGLATGFFERTAAAVVPPPPPPVAAVVKAGAAAGGDEAGGDAATAGAGAGAAATTTTTAPADAPAADASSPSPSSSSSPLAPLLERLYPWLLRSPEAAGDGVLRACLAPDDAAAGAYWSNGRPSRASAFARDPKRGAELWDYAVALCGEAETDESLSR